MTQQNTAITAVNDRAVPGQMLPTQVIQRNLQEMHRLVSDILVENVHYGVIPGTQAKNLLKPGAEELFKAFMCAEDYPKTEVVEIDRAKRYVLIQVECAAVHIGTGAVLARGLGAADSTKYRDGKQDFGWCYNATLKIAKKRAFVDCALSLGAVSAHFIQDMEDAQAEVVGSNLPEGPASVLLERCPLHKIPWYAGKFGKQHNKAGGGWCSLKDLIKTDLEAAVNGQNVDKNALAAHVRQRFSTTWSKLNEPEQVSILNDVIEGRLTPGVPQNASVA